jgi:PAS domain S-box-containing protein
MEYSLENLHDWSKTPLGAPHAWPAELRTAVSFVLDSKFPSALIWGPELTTIHNDAFKPILRAKRECFGRPFSAIWAEVWREIEPILDRAFAGEATLVEDFPLLIERCERAWFTFSYSPVRLADGSVGGVIATVIETTANMENIERLRESEGRFRLLIEGIPQLVWRATDAGQWSWASPQWTSYTGQHDEESHGLGWLDAIHPDDRARVVERWRQATEEGEFQASYRVRNDLNGDYRWFQARATPVRDHGGAILEWLGTFTDVHDMRMLEDRQRVLVAELQHRVRNILTVVRSVFSRTASSSIGPEELVDHFAGRLDALARTQTIVMKSPAISPDLENLIRDELLSVGVADGPNVRLTGPDVLLPIEAVESIGLAIHELTTNALKYGALKVPGAKLDICWDVNLDYGGRRRLDLTWSEQGVPAVPISPTRQGFGTELIEEALPYRLKAETKLEFRGGGVRCSISLPLAGEDPGMLAGMG